MEADWCGCLTRERTVVCTNCLTCFCKAAPSYQETFWMNAPPRLYERKAAERSRKSLGVAANLPPVEVKRPMVMLADNDEEIRAIVQRVCANLGYGFVSAANGQDGLDLARLYHPNLILCDAFLPKLDGREMCRLLKEDSAFASTKMVVMTGIYADTQHMSEAVKRFRIDDYLAKPVSITDLINLLQRYIEGVLDLPSQENLHRLHRKEIDRARGGERAGNTYEVACANCGDMFDAVKAEWCGCAGDKTLVCEHCGKCFCQAPEYRERFWADAPAVLFERKMIGAMRDGAPAPDPPPSQARRPLIVLVEEDEAIQLIVRTVVTTLGYRFIASENAQEALALARRFAPDLILLDAWTTKLDGRETCRRIKEEPASARLKAVVMTGRYADQSYRQEAVSRFKVDDCIAKPLAVDDLLVIVKKYLTQEVRAM
jgi:CheY-like chemotaxis protein